jgi:hypothetical protein
MKAKDFFKSTAFKCLAVLLAITLICSVFLTLCNALLLVSEEEQFQRALSKVYGKTVDTTTINLDDYQTSFDNASIVEAYKVNDDGNYLIKSSGAQGYGGNVICWVVVEMENANTIKGVGKVVISEASGESYIANIKDKHLETFSQLEYSDDKVYALGIGGDDYIKTGASYSMRAISNAVNGAISFVKVYALGATIDTSTIYDDFAYTTYIDKKATTHSFADGVVTYNIVTLDNSPAGSFEITVKVDNSGVITAYDITKYGSTNNDYEGHDKEYYNGKVFSNFVGKDLTFVKGIIGESDNLITDNSKYSDNDISTGATYSNTLILNVAAFAIANYSKAIETSLQYTEYVDTSATTYSYADGVVTYNIVTLDNSPAGSFEITVKVDNSGVITAYDITKYGSTNNDYEGHDKEYYNGKVYSQYVGKNLSYFTAIIGTSDELNTTNSNYSANDISTGATRSNLLCLNAAAYAVANYQLVQYITGGNA